VVIAGEAVQPFMKISQSQYPPRLPSLRSNAASVSGSLSSNPTLRRPGALFGGGVPPWLCQEFRPT